jgi:hypothetical protein
MANWPAKPQVEHLFLEKYAGSWFFEIRLFNELRNRNGRVR